jgi:hypothetical protein
MVLTVPNTPFEGFVSLVTMSPLERDNRCTVEFTGSFEAEDEKSTSEMKKILQDSIQLNGKKSSYIVFYAYEL